MKRMVSLACVLALAVSMMAGCGSKKKRQKLLQKQQRRQQQRQPRRLEDAAAAGDSGKLIMATEAGFAPYEYQKMDRQLSAWMWILPMKSQKRWAKNWKSRI